MSDPVRSAFERCRDMDAPLNDRLQAFADAVRQASPGFQDAVDRFVTRLQEGDAGASAPQVGDVMPDFLLPDFAGRLVSLDDLLEAGPVALVFHRGHWCPYCRMSIDALAKANEAVKANGLQIVAIVPDVQQFAEAFQGDAHGAIQVLCDVDNGFAAGLNLVVWIGDELTGLARQGGVDLPLYHGNDSWSLPIPASFVVDRDKRIVARFVDPDYRKRMPIEDLLTASRCAHDR